MISVAQQALDMLEVQDTMSKHAYCHAAGPHLEEVGQVWVTESNNGSEATAQAPQALSHVRRDIQLLVEGAARSRCSALLSVENDPFPASPGTWAPPPPGLVLRAKGIMTSVGVDD